jgi:hypothetical protein
MARRMALGKSDMDHLQQRECAAAKGWHLR